MATLEKRERGGRVKIRKDGVNQSAPFFLRCAGLGCDLEACKDRVWGRDFVSEIFR